MELKVFLCQHCGVELIINKDSQSHFFCLQTTQSRSTDKDQGENVKNNVGVERHVNKGEVEEFLCGNCAKLFIDNWSFERDVKVHDEERQYGCNDLGILKEPKEEILLENFGNKFNLVRSSEENNESIHEYEQFVKLSFDQNNYSKNHLYVEKETKSRKKGELKKNKNIIQNSDLNHKIKADFFHLKNMNDQGFKCVHCKEKFISDSDLLNHLRIHISEKKYEVKSIKEDLKKYMGETGDEDFIHTGEIASQSNNHLWVPIEGMPCGSEYCKEKIKNRNNNLKDHFQTHTKERPYECKDCGKKFNRSGNLKSHARMHTEEKPYECKQCGKRFSQSGNLDRHMKIHTGEKPYECRHCGKRFNRSGNFKLHLRIHTGEKPYECTHCGKRFNNSGSLKIHVRIHTGDKPYECEHCGKRFSQDGNLQIHMRIHTGDKPYECKYCEKKFIGSGNLERHMRTHCRKYHMNVSIVE